MDNGDQSDQMREVTRDHFRATVTFSPRSREETCRESSQQLRFLNPLLVIALLQLTADVLEAALEGVGQLAGARGDGHHLKLQYVESAQTQVKMVVMVKETLLYWVAKADC